jgi:hypothetical protein
VCIPSPSPGFDPTGDSDAVREQRQLLTDLLAEDVVLALEHDYDHLPLALPDAGDAGPGSQKLLRLL